MTPLIQRGNLTVKLRGLVLVPDHEEFDVTFKVNYFPGDPGRTYGPPENCYPPEPADVEVLSAWMTSQPAHLLAQENFADWDSVYDAICEQADTLYTESYYEKED
jgi:hypothetical protein